MFVAILSAALTVVGCATTPASQTATSSDSTTQTSSGGSTRTTVRETSERAANGGTISERTETVRTTTPASDAGAARP